MAWSLLDSGTTTFADGGSGKAYAYPGGAPASGDLLILGVNSNTVVSTPSGWDLVVTRVQNQGSYIFVREAGAAEADSVTITTSGNHNTAVSYRRYSGHASATPEQTASTMVNGSTGLASPAVAPSALSGPGRLCLLYSMNHSASSAPQDPVVSTGYSVVANTGIVGVGGTAAQHMVLERTDGSGSETPSVTWTDNGGNAFANRYALFVAFTPDAGSVVTGEADAELGELAAAAVGRRTVRGTASAALGELAAAADGGRTVIGVAAAVLGGLAAAADGRRTVHGQAAAELGQLAAAGTQAGIGPGTARTGTAAAARARTGGTGVASARTG